MLSQLMETSVQWVLFSITTLETAIGTFTNAFIIFRLFFSYWRHRDVNAYEKIIAALCISNLYYTWLSYAGLLTFTLKPIFLSKGWILPVIFVVSFFIVITSAWLTASLCFHYFIKIIHFSSSLLSRLKIKINGLASWMILCSVLLSVFCSLLNTVQFIVQHKQFIGSEVSNTSCADTSYEKFSAHLYITFVSTFIPFMISVATTASTAWSLHRHKLKMVKNQTSSSSSNWRKYESAIKIMACLLTFYALIYVGLCLYFFKVFDPYSPVFMVFLVILCAYSPLHSILLSLSSRKLKRAWLRMFFCNAEPTDDDDDDDNRGE